MNVNACSGVARCHSQHQCHFWPMKCLLHGQVRLSAVNHIYIFHEVMNGCKNVLALKM